MRRVPLALALLALGTPAVVSAQGVRGVGLVGGTVESRQTRPREPESGARTGILAGAWVDVQLPASSWSILAEGAWVERGAKYDGALADAGEVQTDYLAMTLGAEWHLDVAFVGAFAYAGPTFDLFVRSRATTTLEPAFREPADQTLSATFGGGVELRVPTDYTFRLEFRRVQGLTPAYRGDQGEFTHRSTEILVRVGRSRFP